MLSPLTVSFYGKLPWVGDFIARNIIFTQQQRLDAWLVNGLTSLKSTQPDWLEKYLSAPVWSFVLPAGAWLDVAVIGSLMPSVDRVGRYFPFVVFSPLDESIDWHLCCFQFSRVATILPGFLEYELLPDVIPEVIVDHLQHAANAYSTDQLSIMDEESLRTLVAEGKSYWWRTHDEVTKGFAYSKLDADLFVRLFDDNFFDAYPTESGN